MSNSLGFSTARKTSRCELLAGWLDNGKVCVFSPPRPASPDIAISTQILLMTFEIPDPSGIVDNGVFTGSAIDDVLIAETGPATWARIMDSADDIIGDVDVGESGSGAFIILSSASLVEGAYCSVVSFTIAEG